jgi:hypothetical protein
MTEDEPHRKLMKELDSQKDIVHYPFPTMLNRECV